MADRKEKYKNEGKTQELRRRRNEAVIELRKSKQESKYSKKRNLHEGNKHVSHIDMPMFKAILERVHHCSLQELDVCVEEIRLKLSIVNPPVDMVIKHDVIPILVRCLSFHDRPNLQFSATWAITNIASSDYEHTKAVVDCNAVPHLINLLSSPHQNIATQAVWALGNITGDCAYMRDLCVNLGYVNALLPLINENTPVEALRTCSWALSNLCRYRDPPPMRNVVMRLLPYMMGILLSNDTLAVVDGLWAATYITDSDEDYVPIIVDREFMPIFKELLVSNVPDYYAPLIRVFGNIASNKDHIYTQLILDNNILEMLIPQINSPSLTQRKETIWFLSNLAAGTHSQIQTLIDSQCIPIILEKFVNDKVLVKNEVTWVFRNILAGGSIPQIQYILELDNFVEYLCGTLDIRDFTLQMDLLKCIHAMLTAAGKTGDFEVVAGQVEICSGLTKIEELQNSESNKVAIAASNVIKKHFLTFGSPNDADVSAVNDYVEN